MESCRRWQWRERERRGMKRGEKRESTLVQAAKETGERTEERGIVVPDTDVTLSLEKKF